MKENLPNNKVETKVKESFDMGTTPMWKLFKKTWIPTLISGLIGGTFVVFDTFFISQGYQLGEIGSIWNWGGQGASIGVAAITYIQAYTFLIVGAGFLVGTAISEKMAKAKAANDNDAYMKAYNSYFPTTILVGGIIGLVLFVLAKPLVWMGSGFQPYYLENWFNNPLFNPNWSSSVNADLIGQQLAQSTLYLRIQALGAIPYVIMISGAQVLRIEGKGNMATWFAIAALITNIVGDFVLVNVLGLNLVGAAIATVAAQLIAMTLYLWYFNNKFPIKMGKWNWDFAKKDIKTTMKMGRTSFLLQGINFIILISITMGIGILFWGDAITILIYQSTFQGYFSLYTMGIMVVVSIAISMVPIVTYNKEAKKYDRVASVKKIAFNLAIAFAIAYSMLFIIFPNIAGVFTDPALVGGGFPFDEVNSGNGISQSYVYRITQMLFISFAISAFYTVTANYLQSVGKTKQSGKIILIKPLILFPVILIMGFSTMNVTATWTESLLPWVGDLETVDGEYLHLGMFWGLLIVDLVPFAIAIFYYLQDKDELASMLNKSTPTTLSPTVALATNEARIKTTLPATSERNYIRDKYYSYEYKTSEQRLATIEQELQAIKNKRLELSKEIDKAIKESKTKSKTNTTKETKSTKTATKKTK